jgi:hypothetical protein
MKLLDNKFAVNDISNSYSKLTDTRYYTPSPKTALNHETSVIINTIDDNSSIQSIDGQCTVKVAEGVSTAAETVQKSLI